MKVFSALAAAAVIGARVVPSLAQSVLPPQWVAIADQALRQYPAGFGTINVTKSGNVTRATISHPPIQLFDLKLGVDMYRFLTSMNGSNPNPPKVVIFDSADPDIYIGHFDFSASLPPSTDSKTQTAALYICCTRLLQNLTRTIFVGEVNGRATGAGDELLVQMDMRFAGPKARLASLEIALGQPHGVGGASYLKRLINQGRASQYLLTGQDIDGQTAAQIGWVNEYFTTVAALDQRVQNISQTIGLYPVGGINATKIALQSGGPPTADLDRDLDATLALGATPVGQALIKKFLQLSNNQTRNAFELGLDGTLYQLYQ